MRISDWSSDVCSSDLHVRLHFALKNLTFDGQIKQAMTGDDGSNAMCSVHKKCARCCTCAHRLDRGLKDVGQMSVIRVKVERSDERRVGKECVSTCRSRWWPYN